MCFRVLLVRLEKTWEPKDLLARRSKQVCAAGMGEKGESWKGLKEPPLQRVESGVTTKRSK